MTPPALGPILTHCPDLPALRRALALMRADCLKVVSAWGVPGGWAPATLAEAAHLVPLLILRTTAGDPSYRDGATALPYANQVLDEAAPWARARPDLVVEIGNEPLNGPPGLDLDPHVYAYHFGRAVDAVRLGLPRARLLAPAFSLNALTPEIERWLTVLAPHYRRCDGVAIHAYTPAQLALGLTLTRRHIGDRPVWLTEVNLGEPLPDVERARRLWSLVASAPVEAALVYHLDLSDAPATEEQGPGFYRLSQDMLATLGLRDEPAAPLGEAEAPRRVVEWVGMSRQGRYTPGRTRPIRAVVLHATAGRGPGDLDWLRQGGHDTDTARRVSCHYCVSRAGRIAQMVAERDTAWHAGRSTWTIDGITVPEATGLNPHSVGVELENLNDGREPYPPAQLDAAAWLVAGIVGRYAIPRSQVVRHLDISPGRKSDPKGFPWESFLDRVFGAAWGAWGDAYPLPVEQRGYAIPRAWLAEQRAGRPLGAATGPEVALAPGRAARAFAGGVVVWLGGDRVEVVR